MTEERRPEDAWEVDFAWHDDGPIALITFPGEETLILRGDRFSVAVWLGEARPETGVAIYFRHEEHAVIAACTAELQRQRRRHRFRVPGDDALLVSAVELVLGSFSAQSGATRLRNVEASLGPPLCHPPYPDMRECARAFGALPSSAPEGWRDRFMPAAALPALSREIVLGMAQLMRDGLSEEVVIGDISALSHYHDDLVVPLNAGPIGDSAAFDRAAARLGALVADETAYDGKAAKEAISQLASSLDDGSNDALRSERRSYAELQRNCLARLCGAYADRESASSTGRSSTREGLSAPGNAGHAGAGCVPASGLLVLCVGVLKGLMGLAWGPAGR